jgi:hypothetical protein
VSSGLNWSEPLGEQIKGYMALQISRRLRRGHSDGIHALTLELCSQSFHYELSTQNTYEIMPIFAKRRHHSHGRTLLPSHTQKVDRQLPTNTWRQCHFHLGLTAYQRLDCLDFRTLNVNVLPLVDSTGLTPSLAASMDKIVLQLQYSLLIFQLRYATSHSGTT